MCGYVPARYSGKQVSSSLYEATFSQYLINLVKLTLDGTMGPKRIWTSQSWIFHVYLKYYLSNLRFMVGCLSQRDPLKCLMFRSGQSTLFNQSTTFNVPHFWLVNDSWISHILYVNKTFHIRRFQEYFNRINILISSSTLHFLQF